MAVGRTPNLKRYLLMGRSISCAVIDRLVSTTLSRRQIYGGSGAAQNLCTAECGVAGKAIWSRISSAEVDVTAELVRAGAKYNSDE